MKQDVELYCLIDGDGEQAGMISTNAPESEVKRFWKILNREGIPQDIWKVIMEADADDEAETEQLVLLLEHEAYTVKRVWYTEITA